MLNVEIKPHKGILFVRLSGPLNKANIQKEKKEVNFLNQIGIKNVVYNLENVNSLDSYGINMLKQSNNICTKNNGIMLICISNNKLKRKLKKIKNIQLINNEMQAINIVNKEA